MKKATLHETTTRPSNIHRPNGGAMPCISPTTGRRDGQYKIPQTTPAPESYFGGMRSTTSGNGAKPMNDAPIKVRRKK